MAFYNLQFINPFLLRKVLDQLCFSCTMGKLSLHFCSILQSILHAWHAHILRLINFLLMNAYHSYKQHNLVLISMECKCDCLFSLTNNNIHIYHNDNNLLFLQLCIFHIFYNEISIFLYIYHQKVYIFRKSIQQIQFYNFHNFFKGIIYVDNFDILFLLLRVFSIGDSFLDQALFQILLYHGIVYMERIHCILDIFFRIFECNVCSQIFIKLINFDLPLLQNLQMNFNYYYLHL